MICICDTNCKDAILVVKRIIEENFGPPEFWRLQYNDLRLTYFPMGLFPSVELVDGR
jgi:hypothetical protein